MNIIDRIIKGCKVDGDLLLGRNVLSVDRDGEANGRVIKTQRANSDTLIFLKPCCLVSKQIMYTMIKLMVFFG